MAILDTLFVLGGAVLLLGLCGFLWVWLDESRTPRLTCLMYHRFVTDEAYASCAGIEAVYSLPLTRFADQLDHLERRGYRSVSAREAHEFLAGGRDLAQPAVLITIDDGCRSVLDAVPLLRRHGFRATLFVTTDPAAHVFERPGQARLSDAELRALDPGVLEVQAHGVTHRPLVALPDAELRRELHDSRAALERAAGLEVRYMAIPGNWYDRRVLQVARECGYAGVFVSDAGTNRPGRDPYRIRRLNVEGLADLRTFARNLRPAVAAQIRVISALKRLPGRLVGPRLWLPLRERLRGGLGPRALSFSALRAAALVLALALFFGLAVAWWVAG